MAITGETTLSEVAKSLPASIRVFERYGIDFCCGGAQPLAEACQEKGVTVEQLLAEVEKVQQAPESASARDWSAATLSELIQHILDKHHTYLHAELPRLEQMLGKVIEAHGEKHGDSLQPLGQLYAGLIKELQDHMWKEENILFPFIQRMEQVGGTGEPMGPGCASVTAPIGVMEMEHESAGGALRQMREGAGKYQVPEDGCQTYRALLEGLERLEADLHEHIHLENNILFPGALELEEALAEG